MQRGKGNFQHTGKGKSQNDSYGAGLGTNQFGLEKSTEDSKENFSRKFWLSNQFAELLEIGKYIDV